MTQAEWRLWVLERWLARIFFGRRAHRVCWAVFAVTVAYFLIRGAIALLVGI
jgi:hypothetical protein